MNNLAPWTLHHSLSVDVYSYNDGGWVLLNKKHPLELGSEKISASTKGHQVDIGFLHLTAYLPFFILINSGSPTFFFVIQNYKNKGSHVTAIFYHSHVNYNKLLTCKLVIRDRSLIMGGGGLQNGKVAGPKLVTASPAIQGKTFYTPLPPQGGHFLRPTISMAKA